MTDTLIKRLAMLAMLASCVHASSWNDSGFFYLPELRIAEAILSSENDLGDDQGPTYAAIISGRLVFEDEYTPDYLVKEFSILAGSRLSTRFEGSISTDGRRRQFPREENLLLLQAKFGRQLYGRIGIGIKDTNFEIEGRRNFATYHQIIFHNAVSNSTRVENLDIGNRNIFSVLGSLGVGGEIQLFDYGFSGLLVKGDIGVEFDSYDIGLTTFEATGLFKIGLYGDVTADTPTPLAVIAGLDLNVNEEVSCELLLALETNIQTWFDCFISVDVGARIPIIEQLDDFYDPNPEPIFFVSVGLSWDKFSIQ